MRITCLFIMQCCHDIRTTRIGDGELSAFEVNDLHQAHLAGRLVMSQHKDPAGVRRSVFQPCHDKGNGALIERGKGLVEQGHTLFPLSGLEGIDLDKFLCGGQNQVIKTAA